MGDAGKARRDTWPGIGDLLEDLLFPKLLRAAGLALRPERILIALFALLLIEVIAWLPRLWLGEAWSDQMTGLVTPAGAWVWAEGGPLARALAAWETYPWSMTLVLLLGVVAWAVGGCMVARMAACDFSQGVLLGIAEARNFATTRVGSLVFAVIGPLLLVGLIGLGLAVGGWVLLSIPYVNVAGSVLYAIFLMGGALMVVLLVAYVLGFLMLVPAVACEGSDGIDAIGRAYPYVFGRPLRLVFYLAIAGVIGYVVIVIALAAAGAINWVTAVASGAFLGPRPASILDGGADLAGGGATAQRVVEFWTALVVRLGWAYALSYVFCSSTLIYLFMRRACDGQDVAELWMPGMVEGTMAESMKARAEASGLKPSDAAAPRAAPPEEVDSE